MGVLGIFIVFILPNVLYNIWVWFIRDKKRTPLKLEVYIPISLVLFIPGFNWVAPLILGALFIYHTYEDKIVGFFKKEI